MGTIVFSDIAGTIVQGNPWDYIRKHPDYDQRRGRYQMLLFLPVYVLWRVKLVSDSFFRDQWLHRMARSMKGLPRETIQRIFDDVIEKQMAQLMRKDVVERLQRHRQNGDKVVLVSGMFMELGYAFAKQVDVDDVIGSYMGYSGGIADGSVAGKTCVGTRKVEFIRQYLAEHHPHIDIKDCYGYADSYSDRSLIDAVGHGVVTYPEEDMRQFAEARGWEIMPA